MTLEIGKYYKYNIENLENRIPRYWIYRCSQTYPVMRFDIGVIVGWGAYVLDKGSSLHNAEGFTERESTKEEVEYLLACVAAKKPLPELLEKPFYEVY